MNPLMTFDHTNPFSALNTTAPQELREHVVIQIPPDYSRLEAQLLTPMNAIAHERQFVTAQLGHNNSEFEGEHKTAIAYFLNHQDRVLGSLSDAIVERDYLLRCSMPMGTELPATMDLRLVIDEHPSPPAPPPPPTPVPASKSKPAPPPVFKRPTDPSFPSTSTMAISFINNPRHRPDGLDDISVDSHSSALDVVSSELLNINEIRRTRDGTARSRVCRAQRFRELNSEILQERQPSRISRVDKKVIGRDPQTQWSLSERMAMGSRTPKLVRGVASKTGKRQSSEQVDDAIHLGAESDSMGDENVDRWKDYNGGRHLKRVKFEHDETRRTCGSLEVEGADEAFSEDVEVEKGVIPRAGCRDFVQQEVETRFQREPDG